jgi:hypothetical protein
MTIGHDHPDALAPREFRHEVGIVRRAPLEAEIHEPRLQVRDLMVGRKLVDADIDIAVCASEQTDQFADGSGQHGSGQADVDDARAAGADRPRPCDRLVGLRENPTRSVEQIHARRRQDHAAARSLEQLGADLRFQVTDLLTQRWL